tara:strand:+ start:996 stop:1211 length:216 start_codon:yes stop_codon:yes gene_type:complete
MKRKNKRLFGLVRLTTIEPITYDVITINLKNEITKIGSVSNRDDALKLKASHYNMSLRYYMLEDTTVLQQL